MKSQKVTTVRSQDIGKRNGEILRRTQEMQPNYEGLPPPPGDSSPQEIGQEVTGKWCKLMSKIGIMEELQSWE